MLEFKTNQIQRLPVRLVDSGGAPVVGVPNSGVSCTFEKADGTTVTFAPSGGQWVEVTDGSFSGQGKYTLIVPASFLNQAGILSYACAGTGAVTYMGVVKLIANKEAETNLIAKDLLDYQVGKWQIHVTGADANRLVLYRADGVTVLKKFDLANANGDPTFINPFRRTPV